MPLQWEPDGRMRGHVVLVHDLGSDARTWSRIGPRLAARGWQVRAVDLAGHGAMPRLARPIDMAGLVEGVVEALPGRADILIGHGFGGVVALTVAGRYGGATTSVVAEDPPSGGRTTREALAQALVTASPLAHSHPDRLATQLALANPEWSEADIRRTVEGLAQTDVPPLVAGLRNRIVWDLPGLVAMLRVPLLVLTSPEDLLSPASKPREPHGLHGSDRKEVQNLLPAHNLVELEGGHALHRAAAEQWLAAVTVFADAALA